MISKKKAFVGAIIIIIITSVLHMTFGNLIHIRMGEKVVITRADYERFREINQTYNKMFTLKDYLMTNYYQEIDEELLIEGAISGMFDGIGDPYTVYMDQEAYEEMWTRTQGTYGGIGVIVTTGDDGMVTVVSPIEDTPGERAGITTGDKITAVDGQPISGERLDNAVDMMTGEPGTDVALSIFREPNNSFDVVITREEIRLQTVRSEILDGQVGYIRITMFDEKTAQDFKNQLSELESQDIQGLVLDLRNNPGGLLSQCIEIADLILGEQVIVYTEDRQGRRKEEHSGKKHFDKPLAILVNEGSASASEILAGAVRDTDRGTIIGTTTYGKGLVQEVKPLGDGSGFKYTVSEYFTPNGENIHGTGIEPDIVLELPTELEDATEIDSEQDNQLNKAVDVLLRKINN
ncbi:S41 family peptidase [Serpentinicella sp. ANB-PHB4]|uniref:S41 family peptidase n=1 Tax=Serpentinicella sp. ANB-PHB4 TaxID=3074076 RepID=UPI00285B25FC|nr:S41 family peptidase [Serpentinicella sp. ANB-PHB4]MDR5659365.1 S41 family peptidase [Serpentinicella sp. ANB-PHB4]